MGVSRKHVTNIFSLNSPLSPAFFDNIVPIKFGINTKKLKRESYYLRFRRLQNNIAFFFSVRQFCKQHQELIWDNNNLRYQKELKEKHHKGKACWVNNITAPRSIHYLWKKVLIGPFYRQPPIWLYYYMLYFSDCFAVFEGSASK